MSECVITEQVRLKRANALLKARLELSHLVIKDCSPEQLLQKAAESLTAIEGVSGAWIIVSDTSENLCFHSSLLQKSAVERFLNEYEISHTPKCFERAEQADGNNLRVVHCDKRAACEDCPLLPTDKSASSVVATIESNSSPIGHFGLILDSEGVDLVSVKEMTISLKEELTIAWTRMRAEESNRATKLSLDERVKEITCLYSVSEIAHQEDRDLSQTMAEIVELLPAGWQYPELTVAAIEFAGQTFVSEGFKRSPWNLHADVCVGGTKVGAVDVYYLQEMEELHEGPFLLEERKLINAIAERLSSAIARQQAVLSEKQAHETIEDDRKRFLAILDGIEDVIYVSDPTTYELVHVNDTFRRFWGGDVLGKKCYAVLQGRDEPCPFCTNDKIFGENLGKQHVWEFQNEKTKRWYRCADKAIRWTDGRMLRFELAGDISELKNFEANLQRSNKELEQFAYVASHDLQEPLRMVSSFTQLLSQKYSGKLDAQADKYINYAVDGAIRMQQLINDLLSYSRVTTRGARFEVVDSHEALGQAIGSLQVAIEESRALIMNDELPIVWGDKTQLSQLFQNLLSNAIKFRKDDLLKIFISAKEEEAWYRFSVKDNGIGFDPKHAQRVFSIFQRLHSRRDYEGTGIGLALCKRIVERHGGEIAVETEPGMGTTFTFTIPKFKDPEDIREEMVDETD